MSAADGVRVETRPYRTVYGREPRGRGRWAFALVHPDGRREEPVFADGKLYAQARADAVALALIRGATTVEVLP